jgi:1-phosphatidylinositol-4-phosphate 5-kinase
MNGNFGEYQVPSIDYAERSQSSVSEAMFRKRKISELPGAKITAFASSLF